MPSTLAFIGGLALPQTRFQRALNCGRRPRPPLRVAPAATPRCCLPTRSTDARGFVLPDEGDVVLFAGRWSQEDALGLVSGVRFIESRGSHVVDIVELRRISSDLFAIPSARARRKGPARWMDVADVRVASDAEYVPTQDAYRVTGMNDGYAPVAPLDPEAREKADREYAKLKRELLVETQVVGVAGTVLAALALGPRVGGAFAAGSLASTVYLAMLQGGVDAVGKEGLAARLLGLRFAVPIVPFLALAVVNGGLKGGVENLLGSIGKQEALAIVIGLLTYKVPLFTRTGSEFVDGLADFEMGKTGMVGTVAGLAARRIKKNRDGEPGETEEGGQEARPVIVFSGPSGVGKSTLMHRLMDEYPGRFDYSVSHTTREKREGEEDGVDYNFVQTEDFEKMIEEGQFVEYARVHGKYYGTSYDAVNAVLSLGNACILDLDVQGVDALWNKSGLDWDARLVWIAPPSLEALEERLLQRGTETSETLKIRLDTATREISYAATNSVFDFTIINENEDEAYGELRDYINKELPLGET
ncbi:unnamed protein product [Chondrus crispus]|uniref:guanylate kinase n=1 Tax=Chondrus crispus TaxID=2769 RepID=R7QUB0_CHOCR|nr:unnamed protein product [Chondrus crispus]CDF41056.1 unnamed protein product [Chondrus crispus]|eukprot:XP_005711350.1 unnamed protein product [Chondrus crispus]